MRLRNTRSSRNVIDRRRHPGMGGRVRRGGRTAGVGSLGGLLLLGILFLAGVDVAPFLNDPNAGRGQATQTQTGELTAEEQQAGEFASRVLATTEDVWGELFPRAFQQNYNPPQLVLFSGTTQSACGGASASTGPFYCPADSRAYLDTQFFAYMSQQLGAGGDFAAAYVIAHEVAHHIQNELGILGQANRIRAQSDQLTSNRISVMIELQADCLSGVWARNVTHLLEQGDLQEALNAAERIGDDYLASRAGRASNPHTHTHGTSDQRQRWFAEGFETGDPLACDTFNAARL